MLVNFTVYYKGLSRKTFHDIHDLVGYESIASGYFKPDDLSDIEFEMPEADWPRVKRELERSGFEFNLDSKEADMPRTKTKETIPEGMTIQDAVYETTEPVNQRPARPELKHIPVDDMPEPKREVPLADGSVARYYDEGDERGIAIQIAHPDPNFRPSQHVLEALKEPHEGVQRHQWFSESKAWVKPHIENAPEAERQDSKNRFQQMIERRNQEIQQGR